MAFHRGKTPLPEGTGIQERIGDRADSGALASALHDFDPDALIDLFAMTETGTRPFRDLSTTFSGPKLMVSSCDVYYNFGGLVGKESGSPSPAPLTEESPVRECRRPYADASRTPDDPNYWRNEYDKIPLEIAWREIGGAVLRLPMVYGPGDFQRRLRVVADPILKGEKEIRLPKALAQYRFCRGYIDHMADAFLVALSAPADTYHVADEASLTELEWTERVARAMDWNGKVVEVENEGWPEPLEGFRYPIELNTARIRSFGHRDRWSLDEAITRSARWELEQPR